MHATPKSEVEHIIGSLSLDTRIPAAHGIPKPLKGKVNLPPCRPVVTVTGVPFIE